MQTSIFAIGEKGKADVRQKTQSSAAASSVVTKCRTSCGDAAYAKSLSDRSLSECALQCVAKQDQVHANILKCDDAAPIELLSKALTRFPARRLARACARGTASSGQKNRRIGRSKYRGDVRVFCYRHQRNAVGSLIGPGHMSPARRRRAAIPKTEDLASAPWRMLRRISITSKPFAYQVVIFSRLVSRPAFMRLVASTMRMSATTATRRRTSVRSAEERPRPWWLQRRPGRGSQPSPTYSDLPPVATCLPQPEHAHWRASHQVPCRCLPCSSPRSPLSSRPHQTRSNTAISRSKIATCLRSSRAMPWRNPGGTQGPRLIMHRRG